MVESGQQFKPREKRERRPDDNTIQVSSKRNANFYVFLAKKIMQDHE